jgi:hypothetical protein
MEKGNGKHMMGNTIVVQNQPIRTDWINKIQRGKENGTLTCTIWLSVGPVGVYARAIQFPLKRRPLPHPPPEATPGGRHLAGVFSYTMGHSFALEALIYNVRERGL